MTALLTVIALSSLLASVALAAARPSTNVPAGQLYFGLHLSHSPHVFRIEKRRSKLRTRGTVAWLAHFQSPAGSHHLFLELWLNKGKKTVQLGKVSVSIHNPKTTLFGHEPIPMHYLRVLGAKHTGRYTLGYVVNNQQTLAEGHFRLIH